MEEINELNNKLDLLLKQHKVLKAEKLKLEARLEEGEQKMLEQQERIAGLEQRVMLRHLEANAALKDGEKIALRAELDAVLEGIEQMLQTLHD